MPRWFIGVVTFILVLGVGASGIFWLMALLLSLWAGVFWYGVSVTTTGVVLKLWLDYITRRV